MAENSHIPGPDLTVSNLSVSLIVTAPNPCKSDWGEAGRKLHIDPFSRLYWVRSGEGFFKIRNQNTDYHLRPGFLFLIPAHTPTYLWCPEKMDILWCHFNARIFAGIDFFEAYPCDLELNIPAEQCKKNTALWLRMIDAFWRADFASRVEAEAVLRLFLSDLFRTIDEDVKARRSATLIRLRPIINHIEENYRHQIEIAKLARIISLQPHYFSNLFTREMGMPPLRYINWRRIKEAQSLLRFGSLTVKEIAHSIGFDNEFYFSKMFHSMTGVTPTDFRSCDSLDQ